MFLNCGVQKALESPLDCKEIQPVHPKGNQSWTFIRRTDAEAETPILWAPDAKNWLNEKKWCWGRLRAGGEGDNKGEDGSMASLPRWTWVWASSGSWWWTGNSGMLPSMQLQRVRHTWVPELNSTDAWFIWHVTSLPILWVAPQWKAAVGQWVPRRLRV